MALRGKLRIISFWPLLISGHVTQRNGLCRQLYDKSLVPLVDGFDFAHTSSDFSATPAGVDPRCLHRYRTPMAAASGRTAHEYAGLLWSSGVCRSGPDGRSLNYAGDRLCCLRSGLSRCGRDHERWWQCARLEHRCHSMVFSCRGRMCWCRRDARCRFCCTPFDRHQLGFASTVALYRPKVSCHTGHAYGVPATAIL